MQTSFRVHEFTAGQVPILVSVPHCGTAFPGELSGAFKSSLAAFPDDTDWFVDQLYDFAPSMGMTMISAHFSRWVIDLNRDPESRPLYTDGRIITGLCPTTDFLGNDLYSDHRQEIQKTEIDRRLKLYFWPYHLRLQEELAKIKNKFGKVLLWDCHSIRQVVPTIQKNRFPDLILGSADGSSASEELIDAAVGTLGGDRYKFSHNHPFKGGYITRAYGKPRNNIHALQLEMTKVNYMDDAEKIYDSARADTMRELLKRTLAQLAEIISS
jgi:N-formylglutamate deformylase